MRLIRKTLKYGIPVGATYLSIDQKLWSPLTQQEINDKLSVVHKYEQQIQIYLKDSLGLNVKIPQLSKIPDVKCLWNSGVKTSFTALNNFDFKSVAQKLEKLFQTNAK